jgi:hypothetical protein
VTQDIQINGRFARGRAKTGGRRKGTPNKATADIKQCFIEAAQRIGSDGRGKGGVRGFIEKTGRANPEALMLALSRFVPPPPKQEDAAPSISVVNIVPAPSGHYITAEQMNALLSPETIDVEPTEPSVARSTG